MSKDFLKVQPSNLPVYAYDLHANIGFVLDERVYLLKGYYFSRIRILSNQALRVGDVLDGYGCYFGNQNTTILQHLDRKGIFDGELRHIYGCQIDKLNISYCPNDGVGETSGNGYCTVFIELTACKLSDEVRALDQRYLELDKAEMTYFRAKQDELELADNLDYWVDRLPHWASLEHVGTIPENLIY
ncbi:MAG: hypothetical protein AAFS12_00280 [Cyanobacteria bacterium J06632_19]